MMLCELFVLLRNHFLQLGVPYYCQFRDVTRQLCWQDELLLNLLENLHYSFIIFVKIAKC